MPSLNLGDNKTLSVYQSTTDFDYAAFVGMEAASPWTLKQRSADLQCIVDHLLRNLRNFAEHVEIDVGFVHKIPCVSAALWHPAFICREWLDMLDDVLAESSLPETWSIHCGIDTIDTPASEYDLYAEAPIISFGFLFNRHSGIVVDRISIEDFIARFQQSGDVPLTFP